MNGFFIIFCVFLCSVRVLAYIYVLLVIDLLSCLLVVVDNFEGLISIAAERIICLLGAETRHVLRAQCGSTTSSSIHATLSHPPTLSELLNYVGLVGHLPAWCGCIFYASMVRGQHCRTWVLQLCGACTAVLIPIVVNLRQALGLNVVIYLIITTHTHWHSCIIRRGSSI